MLGLYDSDYMVWDTLVSGKDLEQLTQSTQNIISLSGALYPPTIMHVSSAFVCSTLMGLETVR